MRAEAERWTTIVTATGKRPLDVLEVGRGERGRPPVLFLHENRGIDEYMLDVVHDLARHGYRVLVPDLLTSQGGSRTHLASGTEPPTPRDRPMEQHVQDAVDTVSAEQQAVVMGMCFGGELAWLTCARLPQAIALAVFYGVGPDRAVVESLDVPFLGIYADDDARVSPTVPATWAGLEGRTAPAAVHRFEGTIHAFHNHHRPERYHQRAATEAWELTLAWLARTLAVAG